MCHSSTSLSDYYRTTYKYDWTKKKDVHETVHHIYLDHFISMYIRKQNVSVFNYIYAILLSFKLLL